MSAFLLQIMPWTIGLGALLASAGTDLRMRIIPNEFVVLVALSGLVIGLGLRPGQIWISLLAATLIFFLLGILCHYSLIGGGDVKLVSAATMLVPPERIGTLLFDVALAGGLLSCVYLVAHSMLKSMPLLQQDCVRSAEDNWCKEEGARIAAGKSVPYAIAILGGVISYIARERPQCLSATSCWF